MSVIKILKSKQEKKKLKFASQSENSFAEDGISTLNSRQQVV